MQAICDRYPDFKMPQVLAQQKEKGTPFAFKVVDLDVKEGIAYITINRPEAMNALNEAVFIQLAEQFTKAEANADVKAIVFQGAGKAFIAGADIRYFVKKIKANQIDTIVQFTREGHELLLKIENCAKLTIALLDGLSLGGGSELALACQAIVATPAASMAFPETSIGIYPGLGGMLRMTRQVGPELAKYYVFTGAPLSMSDALELGIVTRLVNPAEVEAAIKELAAQGKPDKFKERPIPEKFKPLAILGSDANVDRLFAGETPEGVDDKLAARMKKIIGFKAPLALKVGNEIINRQIGKSMPEAVEIELDTLEEI